jgi:hypothetical protein
MKIKIKKGGNIVICLTTGCIFKWIPFFGMIQESIRKQIKWGHNNNLFYEPRSLWGVLDKTLCDKVCQWLSYIEEEQTTQWPKEKVHNFS